MLCSAPKTKKREKVVAWLNSWYQNINKKQKIFIFLVSIALVFVFGIGLLPLVVLIYLQLGQSSGEKPCLSPHEPDAGVNVCEIQVVRDQIKQAMANGDMELAERQYAALKKMEGGGEPAPHEVTKLAAENRQIAKCEAVADTPVSANGHVSLWLAVGISIACFLASFLVTVGEDVGLERFFDNIGFIFSNHLGAMTEFAAQALGGSLTVPTAHVALFSMVESKRNSNTRRRIFIGWSSVLLLFYFSQLSRLLT